MSSSWHTAAYSRLQRSVNDSTTPTNCFRLAKLQNSSSGHRFALLDFTTVRLRGFPGGSDGKESACNAGDSGSIPGLGRSPGEGNGNPLQYSCLENPMDRGSWQATVHGVTKVTDMTMTAAAAAKLLQLCPTLWDPIDGSPPGSPVPGILQVRTLEWVAISFSNARK